MQTLKTRSEDEVKEKEESLKNHCDITKDLHIPQEYTDPYDILICSLLIDATAMNVDEYMKNN